MTIKFADRPFDGPFPLCEWTGDPMAGLYCMMVPDSQCSQGYRAIYFGETGNFNERGFPPARNGKAGWLAIGDYQQGIHIAIHRMPFSTVEERKAAGRQLIRTYQPECNEAFAARSLVAH